MICGTRAAERSHAIFRNFGVLLIYAGRAALVAMVGLFEAYRRDPYTRGGERRTSMPLRTLYAEERDDGPGPARYVNGPMTIPEEGDVLDLSKLAQGYLNFEHRRGVENVLGLITRVERFGPGDMLPDETTYGAPLCWVWVTMLTTPLVEQFWPLMMTGKLALHAEGRIHRGTTRADTCVELLNVALAVKTSTEGII